MGDDGKSNLKGSSEGDKLEIKGVDCAQDAADSCPVQCIKLEK
jgi:ferredoxin